MESLVLASASPRRKDILTAVGLRFVIRPSDIDEGVKNNETPLTYLARIAKEKALAVELNQNEIVLAADTIVVLNEKIYGKPTDDNDARETLKLLGGKKHQVHTGIFLKNMNSGKEYSEIVTTDVYFNMLTEKQISGYVASKEPFGKAGSYAIQGLGAFLVEKIDGCYYNVVGLPITRVLHGLKQISEIDIFK